MVSLILAASELISNCSFGFIDVLSGDDTYVDVIFLLVVAKGHFCVVARFLTNFCSFIV